MVDVVPEDAESIGENIPETAEVAPETSEVDEVVENTNFLISFVSSHTNTLFSEDGFLYSIRS